jgi:hypothetical protein
MQLNFDPGWGSQPRARRRLYRKFFLRRPIPDRPEPTSLYSCKL